MPRIAIYGAGAIGGYLGAKLATTDAEVSLIARGPHLEAIRTNGLTLIEDGKRQTFELTATDDTSELGRQDLVFVTLKAHSIPAGVEPLRCLLGPDTAVVFAVNGAPWWYFHGLDGPYSGHRLETVDPGGVIWSGIGPQRAIGCVVYPAAEVTEPGVVSHRSGDRFSLGEPTGERSERVEALSRLLIAAGLKAPIRPRIRDEIWVKLWGNASFNPVSALTGATLAEIGRDPDTRTLIGRLMAEIQAVGEALDVRFKVDIDKRIDGAVAVGEHKTSMLQDLEKGRPMEIDALIGAVQELGVLVGEPTPTLDTVLALVKQRARLADATRAEAGAARARRSVACFRLMQKSRVFTPASPREGRTGPFTERRATSQSLIDGARLDSTNYEFIIHNSSELDGSTSWQQG